MEHLDSGNKTFDIGITMRRLQFKGCSLELPPDWRHYRDPGGVLTFVKRDGFGELQFSFAHYKGGALPNPTLDQLTELLYKFGDSFQLGEPYLEMAEDANGLRLAAMSFSANGDFVRAWYVSDLSNFAKVTYLCDEDENRLELPDCESIVRSLRF